MIIDKVDAVRPRTGNSHMAVGSNRGQPNVSAILYCYCMMLYGIISVIMYLVIYIMY